MNLHDSDPPETSAGPALPPGRRLLVTAGPTFEPIDAVRFIGNRSSGRLGIALAREAAIRNWNVRLLFGPSGLALPSGIRTDRFQTAADLQALLQDAGPQADVIIMAAAVADFRPKHPAGQTKLRRGGDLTLELEPTPDLLAELAARRRPGQFLVGFALEPAAGPDGLEALKAAAEGKLQRKGVDLIVANPLSTMEAPAIEAVLIDRHGGQTPTPGAMMKEAFASWLLDRIDEAITRSTEEGGT